MSKAKPHSEPIDGLLAKQLLNSTGLTADGQLLGDALAEATHVLAKLVKHAREEIEGTKFAKFFAAYLASEQGHTGDPRITISDTGQVLLTVGDGEEKPAPQTQRLRRTPLMVDLKARAEELGVDISQFGIKRKKIHDYLEKVASGVVKVPKKAPSKSPKQGNGPKGSKPVVKQTEDPGPMSAGHDETLVSDLPDPPPPKGRSAKNGEVKAAAPAEISTPEPESEVSTPEPESEVSTPEPESEVSTPEPTSEVSTPEPTSEPATTSEPSEEVGPVVVATAKPSKSQEDTDRGKSMRQLVEASKEIDISKLLASDSPK